MKTKSIFKVLMVLAMLAGLATGVTVGQAQDGSPPFTIHFDDCDGSANQTEDPQPSSGEAGYNCQTYNGDVYENVEYSASSSAPAWCTDIDSFHAGYDDDYLYVEWTLVGPYDSGCTSVNLVLEIDTDGSSTDGGGLRGDYYIHTKLHTESDKCGSSTWSDLKDNGGYTPYRDSNNDVGGNNPNTGWGCDSTCAEYVTGSGGPGDNYNAQSPPTEVNNMIYCRTVTSAYQSVTDPDYSDQPGFQLAIKRTFFTDPALDTANFRVRAWTSQSSSLPNNKLYWHDENPTDDLDHGDTDVDNTEWASLPGTCQSGDISGDDSVSYDTYTVSWNVTNKSVTPREIESIEASWPDENGNLQQVAFGGNTIWTGSTGEPATINSGWVGNRTLGAGQTKTLVLTFASPVRTNPVNTDPYNITVEFEPGPPCADSVLVGSPTAVTLSSFAAKSSAGGSVSPLWLGLAGLTVVVAGSLLWVKRRAG